MMRAIAAVALLRHRRLPAIILSLALIVGGCVDDSDTETRSDEHDQTTSWAESGPAPTGATMADPTDDPGTDGDEDGPPPTPCSGSSAISEHWIDATGLVLPAGVELLELPTSVARLEEPGELMAIPTGFALGVRYTTLVKAESADGLEWIYYFHGRSPGPGDTTPAPNLGQVGVPGPPPPAWPYITEVEDAPGHRFTLLGDRFDASHDLLVPAGLGEIRRLPFCYETGFAVVDLIGIAHGGPVLALHTFYRFGPPEIVVGGITYHGDTQAPGATAQDRAGLLWTDLDSGHTLVSAPRQDGEPGVALFDADTGEVVLRLTWADFGDLVQTPILAYPETLIAWSHDLGASWLVARIDPQRDLDPEWEIRSALAAHDTALVLASHHQRGADGLIAESRYSMLRLEIPAP